MLRTSGFVADVMLAHNRPDKGDASRAFSQSDSPGGRTVAQSGVYYYVVKICAPVISCTWRS